MTAGNGVSCPSGIWARRASNRSRFGLSRWISAVSSITTIRLPSGIRAARAFSSVVFPVPVPPEMRMLRSAAIAATSLWASADDNVPISTRSSSVYRRPNLRIVRAGPAMAHGGNIAATRDPSSSRASRIGCNSEISSPQARAMFLMATVRFRDSSVRSGTSSTPPARSTKTRRPPSLTINSVTAGSRNRSSIGRRNGRIRSRLLITLLARRDRSSSFARRGSAASSSKYCGGNGLRPSYGNTTACAFCSSMNTRDRNA